MTSGRLWGEGRTIRRSGPPSHVTPLDSLRSNYVYPVYYLNPIDPGETWVFAVVGFRTRYGPYLLPPIQWSDPLDPSKTLTLDPFRTGSLRST